MQVGLLPAWPFSVFLSCLQALQDSWREWPANARSALGEEYFVFSTDYPHADSKYPESADRLLELPLSESAMRRIMWDNCARLYGIA